MVKDLPVKYQSKVYKLKHLPGHYIEVPKKMVIQLGGSFSIRLLCTINDIVNFQCGLMALGEGSAYITLNTARMKKLGVKPADKVNVELKKDESKYGMKMPEELDELLKQDKEGMRRFKLLPPGKQRYIIYYVAMVKNPQLRIDRAILLIENLKKLPVGKESFREMLGK